MFSGACNLGNKGELYIPFIYVSAGIAVPHRPSNIVLFFKLVQVGCVVACCHVL